MNQNKILSICQLPKPLKPGDLLRVITPSGSIINQEVIQAGIKIWENRGYQVELASGYDQTWGYLAGTDQNRRQQLIEAWSDPNCRGILCARGGYGAMRLLENWDWNDFRFRLFDPPWLIGFSDITALLWSLAIEGIASLHGPVLTTLINEPDWSLTRLFNWLEQQVITPLQGTPWGTGTVTGILLPANLTVATHLLHTNLQPSLTGVILAIEDVTEYPYRIDRVLTQWRLSGQLKAVKGIAIGRFSRCDNYPPSFTVLEVLKERLSDLAIPIVSDLDFGHDGPNAVLPVGVMAELNADQGSLTIL